MTTFGSVFTGIGGFDVGWERAGLECVWQIECDDNCNFVLERHWPQVKRYTDVRTVPTNELVRPDWVCGGFPCQDLSVSGKRAGLAGERSGLFFEFARIVGLVRPRWLLVENVPGLLSSNGGRDFGVLLDTLADLGYGLAWRILDSRFFGVPQRRRRVFIVGAETLGDPRAAAERAAQVLALGSRCKRHSSPGGTTRSDLAGAVAGRSASRLDDQGTRNLVSERYYVEDGENGTLLANGKGGPRFDKQPLLVNDVAAPLSHG